MQLIRSNEQQWRDERFDPYVLLGNLRWLLQDYQLENGGFCPSECELRVWFRQSPYTFKSHFREIARRHIDRHPYQCAKNRIIMRNHMLKIEAELSHVKNLIVTDNSVNIDVIKTLGGTK